MQNILLTGANGFIGNYFVNNYSSKYKITTFSFFNDNFKDLNMKNINVVVHLSALVHQIDSVIKKEKYKKINIIQTVNLAQKAKKSGVKYFIFMSTVKVYGEETDTTYSENSECNPQDEYGKSKLKAEQELQKLSDNNFKVTIIRTPIVYGYGVKANIKNLINLVNKVPILPFGNIQNCRSIVYVGNLCHLINIIILKKKGGVFLASDDKAISTTKLIELVAKELNKKIFFIKIPFLKEILKSIKPSFYKRLYKSLEIDNNITKKALDYKNLYTIEDGIKYMIKGENNH